MSAAAEPETGAAAAKVIGPKRAQIRDQVSMFTGHAVPRVFTIAPGRPFAEVLAEGVAARLPPDDPLALARVTIYAPTRRGARALVDSFAAQGGAKPVLVPRVRTLGDLDDPAGLGNDLPPAIDPTERLLVLTRLVREMAASAPHLAREATATALARDLTSLLDQAYGERLSLAALDGAAPENHAEHWSETLRFLRILREAWPAYLDAAGRMDEVARRGFLIARQIEQWQEIPPVDPVVVAGSTGSVGISAELIAAVARLPQGAVILPGLDRALEAAAFRSLREEHPDHPQAALARLLVRIGGSDGPVPRDAVRDWVEAEPPPRQRFLSIALRPAPVTDKWLSKQVAVTALAPEALAGVALIEAETAQEEAQAIAFAIREAVEEPEATAGLVTPDRTLARRVSAALLPWGIVADDSAGRPLPLTPPGVFLTLLAEEGLRRPENAGDPARLLALLKHPLVSLGEPRARHLRFLRRVEIDAIRGCSTGADLSAARRVFDGEDDAPLRDWIDTLEDALAPLRRLAGQEALLSDFVTALRVSAEALSLQPDGGVDVWDRETGRAAEEFMTALAAHAAGFGALPMEAAPALFAGLMQGRAVRAPYGQHPRVHIWGTLEARMLSADVMILAGLNEDSWPSLPDPDPWMSRAMRREFGLPPLERRIGLSAHDFQQAMGAERVILTRSRKQDGAPTVASRWLQRITTLLGEDEGGFAPETLAAMRARGERYRGYAAHLVRKAVGEACDPPEPKPPVEARPRRLSVTQVETLIRDPYAIYARRVLRLRPLEPLAPEPDARMRGEVMHRIVERFVADWPAQGETPEALFERIAEDVLREVGRWPVVRAFYRARAERIAPWFLVEESARRGAGDRPVLLEGTGRIALTIGSFDAVELTGVADRIDRMASGTYAVYDYKTGKPPTDDQVAVFAQQLPLEGAMLRAGAFGLEPGEVGKLAYLHLQGGAKGGAERALKEIDTRIAEALPRLAELLAAYARPDQPYRSRSRAEFLTFEGDYDHLARVGEWQSADGENT